MKLMGIRLTARLVGVALALPVAGAGNRQMVTSTSSGPSSGDVVASLPTVAVAESPMYRAMVVSEGWLKGRFAIESGAAHPDALRPLAPATTPSAISLLRKDNVSNWWTVRSYSSGRQYVLPASAAAFGTLTLDPGFSCVFLEDVAASTIDEIVDGGATVGVIQRWHVSLPPDELIVEQELRAIGVTLSESSVAVSLRVQNMSPSSASLGARLILDPDVALLDIYGAGNAGPPLALRFGATPPPEPYERWEHDWTFPLQREWDSYGVPDPSVRRWLYHIGGSISGTSTLVPSATPPDVLHFTLGLELGGHPGLFESCFGHDVEVPPRPCANEYIGPGGGLAYYWGRDAATARHVAPGESLELTTHFYAYADYPVAAGIDAPARVECAGAITSVSVDGSASAAVDGTPLKYTWSSTDPRVTFADVHAVSTTAHLPGPGTHSVSLLVEVGPYSADATATIEVEDTLPPDVVAPLLIEALTSSEVPPTCGADLTLVATASDSCATVGLVASNSRTAGGLDASDHYDVADTLVTFRVEDPSGNAATATTLVRVSDDSPPEVFAASADPSELWPPNHRMVAVRLTADAVDNCDPSPAVRVVSVRSNEHPNSRGDGSTLPDAWVDASDPSLVWLRAERGGRGVGRVYEVVVEVTDFHGNRAERSVVVPVARDRRR